MLSCDAAVVPIVIDGAGQPLDVAGPPARSPMACAARSPPATAAAPTPCGRPPSWCEGHHIVPWERGGETRWRTAMLCRAPIGRSTPTDWIVRIRDGLPEFIPPAWIDPERGPRRKALPHLARADFAPAG